jgi:hypothetical protein
MADNTSTFMELTASIVSAYVRHNSVPSAELPALIGQVHTALTRVSSGHGEALANALTPAISKNFGSAHCQAVRTSHAKPHPPHQDHHRRHLDRRHQDPKPLEQGLAVRLAQTENVERP